MLKLGVINGRGDEDLAYQIGKNNRSGHAYSIRKQRSVFV